VSTTVAVPRMQTQNREVNQLQTNIINALQPVGNMINQVTIIGEVKLAILTLTQLQQQAGTGWVACDGTNIVGSAYNKLTGMLATPVIAPLGELNFFMRIN
jgi:hypothetical protein